MSIEIPEFSNNNPGDNFYQYINEKWLKKVSIPSYVASYSITDEIREHIEKDLTAIVNSCTEFSKKNTKATSVDNKLKDVIGKFVLSTKKMNNNSLKTLKNTIKNIGCIRSIDDIGEILGYFCRNKIDTVFSAYVQLERTAKDESIYILHFTHGALGMPDVSYYNASAPGKLKTLRSYINMIKTVCKHLDIEDISLSAATLEGHFAAHIEGISHDEDYILMKGTELLKKYNRFPWALFFRSYGIEEWKSIYFNIQSLKWIHILETTFEMNLNQWKNMFILHLILHALPVLPYPFNDIHFDFFGKTLQDKKKKLSQPKLTLELVELYLTQPLSVLYKKMYLKDSLKVNATHFIEKIRNSALEQIKENNWLEESTKKEAREKVKDMVLSIGWPEQYPRLTLPEMYTDNLLLNIYALSSSSTDEDISLLNKKSIPGKFWNEPTFLVNAYYYNEINEFIVPAASLSSPFFDLKKSKGWNYGGLGAIIGHEMIHAFDDNGRNYNEHGLFKHWWKPRDSRRFRILSKKLITYFNKTTLLRKHVNGEKTLNENLADLGGLSIAIEALKKDLGKESEKTRKREYRDFFISYAVSWRTKETAKKQLQGLFLDVHSPAELRVNNIVCHMDEWYYAFDIDRTSKMYVSPEERIHVY